MGFWPSRKQDKLYKQWAEHSGLPPEAVPKKEAPPKREAIPKKETIPQEEVTRETPARVGGVERRRYILYILLGLAILMLCAGIIILFMQVS